MSCILAMLIDVGIFRKNIVDGPTAKSTTAEQAHPQTIGLIALFAEGHDWRLLIVPTERTGIEGPALKAMPVEVVPTEHRDDLSR
jgi:hypothetical protein